MRNKNAQRFKCDSGEENKFVKQSVELTCHAMKEEVWEVWFCVDFGREK
jgi:hypothetical protein